MDQESKIKSFNEMFSECFGESKIEIEPLPGSGSNREYYRVSDGRQSALGVYNEDIKENTAFLSYTKHFLKKDLNVPKVYSENSDKRLYLIEDFGNKTLYDYILENRLETSFPDNLVKIYEKVLEELAKFQVLAGEDIDYSVAHPSKAFDEQAMRWDLSYFKYMFLKLAKIPFDEKLLEKDFDSLIHYILEVKEQFFLYRDFQSMNIMIKDNTPYFIDYQGGRQGSLQYDIASLLYDSKANLPFEIREHLLEHYITNLSKYHNPVDDFRERYQAFVLIRLMQAMGAYGYRGIYEKKGKFLLSIPYAIKSLEYILNNFKLAIKLNYLWEVFNNIVQADHLMNFNQMKNSLEIDLISISKSNLTQGYEGNIYFFDCNIIAKADDLKNSKLCGIDNEVKNYFNSDENIKNFLNSLYSYIDFIINNSTTNKLIFYFISDKGLMRSVYCAEEIYKYIDERFLIKCGISHLEIENGKL